MARKNREFRPDRTSSGILQKLYITKKQRQTLLRWSLYALVLLVLSLLQDVILCRLRIYGGTTDLLPCVILLVCIQLGVDRGCVFALIASVMYLFTGSSPGFYVMALLVGIGALAAMIRETYLQKGFGSALLCTGGGLMAYELAVFVFTLLFGYTTAGRVIAFVSTGVLSALCIPVLYPIVCGIEKIGGDAWKE